MESCNNNIHAASDGAQDKKVRVRVLGRGTRSKNKLQSPPQADRHRKPTNAVAKRLGRQMGAAHRKRTRVGPNCRDLAIGNWNVSSLTGKEQELVCKAQQYRLDVVGISSTKRRGSGTVELNGGWKIFYSGVDAAMSQVLMPWWNQEVKEAICAKKVAYKAWLANKSSLELRSQYSEARKATATKVKLSKERTWKEFGERLDDDFKTANKVFWQTIRHLRGKRSRAALFIEDSNGVTLKDQDAILNRWRDYFSDLLNPVDATPIQIHEEQVEEDIQITEADVNAVIKSLKTGKAPGEDDIRPEMLKAMNIYGVRWLTRVCKVACSTGQAPKQWQTSVIIPIHKKGDKKKCTNYRGISLISVPGKVYAKCLEKKCREIVEPKLTDAQCGFRPGRGTMDQIFALQQIFEKSWEYAKEVNACFVDLEKAYDRIPRDKLWAVLLQYGIDGQLLTAIKSLYVHSEVCVRVTVQRRNLSE